MDNIGVLPFESLMPHGANLFMYCYNNPVMFVDPDGEGPLTALILGAIVGAMIAGGTSGQIVGGTGSMISGGTAIATGAKLLAFGPIGWIVGGALILIGTATMIWGGTEIYNAVSGDNFTFGMSQTAWNWTGLGLNMASAFGSIGGNVWMRSYSGQIARNARFWDSGTHKTRSGSLRHHHSIHGAGRSVGQYTRDALGFANRNNSAFSFVRGGVTRAGLQRQPVWTLNPRVFGRGMNGLFTSRGRIISFWYWR